MGRLLGLGEKFPEFSLPAVTSIEQGKEFTTVDSRAVEGKWSVFFFWPFDFTFVCPTEIAEFNRDLKKFQERETGVYGASTDSHYVHLAWRRSHPDLKELKFPMLADYKKTLSDALGILHPEEKVPYRATYIVDPEGIIRWVSVYDLSVGRNTEEVLRTLDALQTGAMTPCNWERGKATLS
ncbi:MAG: peroxiredoxin [Nitrospirae bacterium]|nr:peroxiredoxin [Candidatus Manganitrophaceae bacterium]